MVAIRIAYFGWKSYEKNSFIEVLGQHAHRDEIKIEFFEPVLHEDTVNLLKGRDCNAVCIFVDGKINEEVVTKMKAYGVQLVLLRCAGFDNVDVESCKRHGIKVARVAAYSPSAVAEHAATLLMALNRKIPLVDSRVRAHNFTLEGLVGHVLNGKTVGVMGTGRIGKCFINIMLGFGCNVIGYDVYKDKELLNNNKFKYVEKQELFSKSDIISLHMLLSEETKYIIDKKALSLMKSNVIILNTSRGKLIDTNALLEALEENKVGGAGLDVYENEVPYFFHDHSDVGIKDVTFLRLMHNPRVILTPHQAFLTHESLNAIGGTVISNAIEFFIEKRDKLTNEVL